jgi:hypothetical protein
MISINCLINLLNYPSNLDGNYEFSIFDEQPQKSDTITTSKIMRLTIYFFLTILIFTACKKPHQKHYLQVQANKSQDIKIQFLLSKDPDAEGSWDIERTDNSNYHFPKEFFVRLKESVETCPLCYDIDNDSIEQKVLDISVTNKKSDYFDLSDMNFDGNFDISFSSASTCCSGKNVIKDVWIYNPGNQTFIYNSELSESCLWDYNEEKKTLVMGWSLGANNFSSTMYKSIKGKLKEIQRETVQPKNDSVIQIVTEKLKDTVWVSDTTYENQLKENE